MTTVSPAPIGPLIRWRPGRPHASAGAARRDRRNRVAGAARPALPEQRTTIRFESPDGRPAALIDAIEGRASIDDIIVATTNPRLSLVHAGELPLARRPAVAASASLQTVIDARRRPLRPHRARPAAGARVQ